MFKYVLAALVIVPVQAHASVLNDAGFQQVIAKQIARENAQNDVKEALKVVRAVRAEAALARKKRHR